MFRNCVRKTVEVSTMFKHTRGLSLRYTDFDYPFFIFKLFLFDFSSMSYISAYRLNTRTRNLINILMTVSSVG